MTEVWIQEFDEELADFDTVTPAWDGEVYEVADFDATTDVDGDMTDNATGSHTSGNALEFEFDNNTLAFGTIDADAVDNITGFISFWFNFNDVAIQSTKVIDVFRAYNGAGAKIFGLRTTPDGADYKARPVIWKDGAVLNLIGTNTVIPAGWNNIKVYWIASTGAGNDDGRCGWYLNDVFVEEENDLDTDTYDWDYINTGISFTNSTTFGGSFLMGSIKVDPVGGPMLDTLASKNGTYGVSIPIMDTTARYCQYADPSSETAVTLECWVNPTYMTMGTAEAFIIMSTVQDWVYLYYDGSDYRFRVYRRDDSGQAWSTLGAVVTTDWHKVRFVWEASIIAGADDGYWKLYVDDVLYLSETDMDNDTLTVDLIQFGAYASLDAGTYGILQMDDCKWSSTVFDTVVISTSTGTSLATIESSDAVLIFSTGTEWKVFDLPVAT